MRDDELDEELRADLEMEIAERMREGLSRAEAEQRARQALGNLTLMKEVTREIWGWRSLERLGQDLRYAMRMLRRSPGFAAAVVISIALGVGAVTAVFSVVNAVLMRPLGFRDPERLVAVAEHPSGRLEEGAQVSGPDFDDLRDQNRSFDQLAAYLNFTFPLTDEGEPVMVSCTAVSPEFFDALGMKPLTGRTFRPVEFHRDGAAVLISYGFWQRRFGGDPQILGKIVHFNHGGAEIVGVMPPATDLFQKTDAWLTYIPDFEWARQRDNRFLRLVGRLREGVSVPQAREELQAIYRRMPGVTSSATMEVTPLKDQVVGGTRQALIVLMGAMTLVLLIACANVANLLLARGTARQQEIATRFALGASRGRLARQFLTESLLLALMGGATGVLLAFGLVRLLLQLNPAYLPRTEGIHVDLPVMLFALAVSVAAGLVFSVVPVAAASRAALHDRVRMRGMQGRRDQWARGGLVAAELGLAVILLTGAGLLGRSFLRVLSVAPGFRTENVLTVRLRVPDERVASPFYPELLERVANRPGVDSAAVSDCLPMEYVSGADLLPAGRAIDPAHLPTSDACFISAAYFRALGIPLLEGRAFGQRDGKDTMPVAVVSESVARQLWPGERAIGRRLAVNYRALGRPTETAPQMREVVGVVADVRLHGLEAPSRMAVYLPYEQDATRRSLRAMVLFVRTASDPEPMARSLQSDVRALGPDVPVLSVGTMNGSLRKTLAPRTFSLVLLGCFAAIALLLAAAGLYGVVSYAVARRVREIGIRMALGARRGDVLRSVLGQELRWLAVGLLAGLAGASVIARVLRGMLFGVEPGDPWTLACVIALLAAVAVAACWNPANRAMRVDPLTALREE